MAWQTGFDEAVRAGTQTQQHRPINSGGRGRVESADLFLRARWTLYRLKFELGLGNVSREIGFVDGEPQGDR